jgi:hypothetical protein
MASQNGRKRVVKKTGNVRATSAKSQRGGKKPKRPVSLGSRFIALLIGLLSHFWGKIILGFLAVSGLLVLEAWLLDSNPQRFFRIAGLEMVVFCLAGWVLYLLKAPGEGHKLDK